jgi:hypothetical protein
MRSFVNISERNAEESLQSHVCEVGFHHMTDRHCVWCHETDGKEGGGRMSEIHIAVRSLDTYKNN